jgi:hypothetical protein
VNVQKLSHRSHSSLITRELTWERSLRCIINMSLQQTSYLINLQKMQLFQSIP